MKHGKCICYPPKAAAGIKRFCNPDTGGVGNYSTTFLTPRR